MMLPPELKQIARHATAWEADVVGLPGSISEQEKKRMVATLVTAEDLALESDVVLVNSAEPEEVARLLKKALGKAAETVGAWPGQVRVRRKEVAEPLGFLLRDRGCRVEVSSVLPGLDEVARGLVSHVSGGPGWPPVSTPETWAAWGLPTPLVKDLFRAYAAFFKAAPWRWLDDVPPIVVDWDDGTGPWIASVMGAGLGEFGLAVHSDPSDFQDLLDRDQEARPFHSLRGWVVHLGYHHQSEIPRAMVKEVALRGWRVEDLSAYPYVIPILTPGGGLQRDLAHRLVRILNGVAAFADQHGNRLRAPEAGAFIWSEEGLTLRYVVAPDGEDEDALGVEDLLDEVREAGLETREEIEAHLARRVEGYNQRPQTALGGISPAQAQALLTEGLAGGESLRLEEDLVLEELEASDFLVNARFFLEKLHEDGGSKATVAGNLKRAFVSEMLEGMRLREGYLENIHRRNLVVNEDDAWPLHLLRVNLEIAGLIKLRKGSFSITRKGMKLRAPEAAGKLFAHLFRSYFSEFNIQYGERLSDQPSLQPVVPLLLWQLRVRARNWITLTELSRLVLHPDQNEEKERFGAPWSEGAADLHHTVLEPLREFGLLEERYEGETEKWYRSQGKTVVKTTDLFDRFLHFEWD